MSKIIYLDYNATTPIDPRVLEVMLPYFKEKYANPSSKYRFAMDVSADIEKARTTIANCMGAKYSDEIIFTASATESVNHAIRGTLKTYPEKNHIITTVVEHPAVLDTCKDLERDGYKVSFLKVNNNGELDEDEFKSTIKDNTAIISIMHANNETGVVFPIAKLAKIAKSINPNVLFHTDATQSIGKIDVNMYSAEYENIDFLSMSGHKIYAPKGVGILYSKKGTRLRKFITGGHHEFNKRAGTLNVPLIIGMAKAFEILKEELSSGKQDKLAVLRSKIESEVSKRIPYININGGKASRLSNTTNISFDCIEGESILFQLDKLGFCISSGSACTSGSLEPSHVLRAMHVPITSAHSSLRISLGRFTKDDEVEAFINTLPGIISRLREISPFWDKNNGKPNDKAIQYSCQS